MSENLLQLMFKADTDDLDKAKEKLVDLGSTMPTVGEAIEGLAKSFMSIPGDVGLAIAAIGGFGVALTEMVEHTTEMETQLLELSEAIGIPIEKLQPFMEAMQLAGVSGEQLRGSLAKLSQAVGTALTEPTGKAADEFKKLGVSQKELANGDIEQIMKDAAAGLNQYADSATKTATIRDLFGKQGPQIIAAMQGEAQMEAMAADAQEQYGTKISDTDAKSSKYFGETLKLGMSMFEGVGLSVTRSLLPGLQELVNQFAESGKQGGVMRDILDGLSATISVVGKVLISALVEPVRLVVEMFKEAGTAIGGSLAAIGAAATGHLGQAKAIMVQTGEDLTKMSADYAASAVKFEAALWGGATAVTAQSDAVSDGTKKFVPFNATAQKLAETLEQLKTKVTEQLTIWDAASQGLDSYKRAQDNVAIGAELLKLKTEGASKSVLEQAETYLRAEQAAKQNTTSQVSGLNEIARLTTQMGTLISHNTELEKAQAEIKANPGMLEATKQELLADAQLVDAKKQQIEVDKEISAADASVLKDSQQQITSMTLGTDALKKYNTEAKLLATLNKEMIGKTPQQMVQLTNDYNKNVTAIEANTNAVKQFQTSWAGAQAGGVKAMQNLYSSATNLNTMGSQLTTTFVNGLTTAFTTMGQSGKNAFATLTTALITFVEQAIIKFLILKAMIATMEAMGVSAATINLMLGKGTVTASANGNAFSGGSVTPFADGGIVGGPTMVPMALMGEAGPEAVMPLQRSSTGKLGVALNGDSGGGPQTVNHNYGGYVVVNTNQDPHETGKQIKKQMNNMKLVSQGQIAKSQRPGGISNRPQGMFAR